MSELENMSAYELVEKRELKEVDGIGYVLSHKKTKARVMVIVNDDNNKVFTIGFRTPPKDDTGVAHITEHSVLCGSKNFPVKDPFVELCKGSLNTFLNAMTYPDKTVYPVASLNDKDFHNLMHVYLDAVFYPNTYSKEEIMQQEGWHYEVDEATGELKYNGVVFNEMKGVYSNPEQLLYQVVMTSLLPDTTYGRDSGGDPVHIPELTREGFLDFHKKYYHPSNSYIYLYGDVDAITELEFIDREYLSNFEYQEIDSEIADQKKFEKPVYKDAFYSISDNDNEKDNTYLSYNVSFGHSTDKTLATAFEVIENALISMPGAPVKKALVDSGICKDVFSSFDDGVKQLQFSIVAKNSNIEDEERFIEIVNNTFNDCIKNGIDKKSLLASINSFEFKHKEGNFGRFPKGLMLGLNAFDTWLYDDTQALSLFEMNEVYDGLKKMVDTDYFEKLIKEYVIDNTHKTYVKLIPKKGYSKTIEDAEKEVLAAYKATLSEEQIENIKKNAEHLKEYQESEDSEEALKSIPLLKIEDIDKKARKINNKFDKVGDISVVSHDIFTNGIAYLNMHFDITDIDYKLLPAVSLLCEIFKYVDTANHTYNELASEISINTGGIGFSTTISNKKALDSYAIYFLVNVKMFDECLEKGMELIDEILFTSKLDDKKRLKEIIAEARSNIKNDITASGHTSAGGRVLSYISPIGAIKEYTEGLEYYRYLAEIDDNFDECVDRVIDELKTAVSEVLRRDSLFVSYTGRQNPCEFLKSSLEALSKKLSTRTTFADGEKPELIVRNEGIKTASQVQYVATAGNYLKKGLPYTGALSVLSVIFSYDYLWVNVRVKGGAYGCMCAFGRSGNAYFTSYRDPNLMETYDIYKKAPEYVEKFNCNERDMTKYIIGAISKLDAPFTPSAEGNFSTLAWIVGMTDEELQKERDEVLNCTVQDIRNLAPYIKAITDSDTICVIGNENKIEAAKENFKEITELL